MGFSPELWFEEAGEIGDSIRVEQPGKDQDVAARLNHLSPFARYRVVLTGPLLYLSERGFHVTFRISPSLGRRARSLSNTAPRPAPLNTEGMCKGRSP